MLIKSAEFIKSGCARKDYPDDDLPQVAFAGRSNVGKSSLDKHPDPTETAGPFESKTPGRTQTINFYLINKSIYFVDLPGYGYAKAPEEEHKRWKPMVESYLEDNPRLKGIISLIDSRHEVSVLDIQMLAYLFAMGLHTVVAATKIDKLKRSQRVQQIAGIRRALDGYPTGDPIPFSATKQEGRDVLLNAIDRLIENP